MVRGWGGPLFFGGLLWAHPESLPLAFVPALCNQVVGGLPLRQTLAESTHVAYLGFLHPNALTKLYFPVVLTEECGMEQSCGDVK